MALEDKLIDSLTELPIKDRPARWLTLKREVTAGLIVLGAATVIVVPAFIHGFPNGADAVKHYRWANGFFIGLREGDCYPRWLAGANFGLGSPFFIFYPPLLFYVEAAFRFLVGDQVQALLLGSWLAIALSGLTMYTFSRSAFPASESIFAAILYMLIPAHLYEFYQWSAMGELWGFAWVPLLLETTRRTASQPSWRPVPYLGLSYALLVLSHVPTSFVSTLILPVYILILTRNLKKLIRLAAGLILGAGLAGIFVIPVLFERKYIRSEILLTRFDYHDYFTFEHFHAALKEPLFSVGWIVDNEWAMFGLVLLLLVGSFAILERTSIVDTRGTRALLRSVWVVTAISLLMSTRASEWLWRLIPALALLPYPSRWQVVASAGPVVLTTAALVAITRYSRRRILYTIGIAVAVVFNLWIAAITIARAPHRGKGIDPGPYFKEEQFYNPVWWDGEIPKESGGVPMGSNDAGVVVNPVHFGAQERSYAVTAKTESLLKLPTLYFPGWTACVDEKPAELGPGADGKIQLVIPPGEHELTLRFGDTAPRTAGKLVSAISVLILLGLFYATGRTVAESITARAPD